MSASPSNSKPSSKTSGASPSPWKSFFLENENILAGCLLICMAIAAMVWANSSFKESYFHLQHAPVGFYLGEHRFSLSFLHWINDGLMALFFLYAGMEIKKEIISGELSSLKKMSLPVVAAIGGMVVPALIYFSMNSSGITSSGWGIPMATDIAFSMGVLALLGKRVPPSIKVFLLTLAVVDDMGAILVIALFYSQKIHFYLIALGFFLLLMNKILFLLKIRWVPLYIVVGFLIWLSFLGSGIHATIAGVLMGLLVPITFSSGSSSASSATSSSGSASGSSSASSPSPLNLALHALEPWVKFFIMPAFALFNAGVTLGHSLSLAEWVQNPLFLGITLGLFVGKPLGITGFCWLAVRLRWAQLPTQTSWSQVFGVSILAGIGFTMSLFIGHLALGKYASLEVFSKVGVLSGSLLSACIGLWILSLSLKKAHP